MWETYPSPGGGKSGRRGGSNGATPARKPASPAVNALCRGGYRLGLERRAQHLVDRHREAELHRLTDFLGHVVDVAAVSLREHHLGQTCGVRREHLLLDAADRQDAAL